MRTIQYMCVISSYLLIFDHLFSVEYFISAHKINRKLNKWHLIIVLTNDALSGVCVH